MYAKIQAAPVFETKHNRDTGLIVPVIAVICLLMAIACVWRWRCFVMLVH